MTYPDYDLEASEADVAEQATEAAPGLSTLEHEDAGVSPAVEVSEWDAQEQSRVVELEDDYR